MPERKITVVYQCEVSGGTDKLLIHLIKNWPDLEVQWVLYLYESNSGNKNIEEELRCSNVKTIIYRGFNTSLYKSNKKLYLKIFRKIIRIPYILCESTYFANYFKKEFASNKPDYLFLLNGGYPGSTHAHAAAIAGKLSGVEKIIMGIQNLPSLTKKKPLSIVLNFLDNFLIDAYIFGNKRSEDVYRENTFLNKEKLHSINEGVNVNIKNIHCHNNTNNVRVGMIACYEKRKGHSVLFEAIKILKDDKDLSGYIFNLICYGQMQYGDFNGMKNKVSNIGIENYVEFREYEKDMDKLYTNLDIIVLPSIKNETMPLVMIDAQAYYKPVVGSYLQGIIDIIDHEKNGFLFPIGNYKKLAAYLKILILNPEKREKFGLNGRKKYENNFTAEIMCSAYRDTFYNL